MGVDQHGHTQAERLATRLRDAHALTVVAGLAQDDSSADVAIQLPAVGRVRLG